MEEIVPVSGKCGMLSKDCKRSSLDVWQGSYQGVEREKAEHAHWVQMVASQPPVGEQSVTTADP